MSSFLTIEELQGIGFASLGDNLQISRKVSFYSPEKISLGSRVRIDDFCILSGGAGIELGSNIHISAYAAIFGGGGVRLEDNTGLSPRSTIFSESDDFSGESLVHPFYSEAMKPGYISKPVLLEKFSQVGTNSSILPGVELGEGVVIGAHSLVTKSCEPWGIYAGVPVRRLRDRSKKMLTFIL